MRPLPKQGPKVWAEEVLHKDPDEERYGQQILGWEYPVEGKFWEKRREVWKNIMYCPKGKWQDEKRHGREIMPYNAYDF
jgi:hypothetical protein